MRRAVKGAFALTAAVICIALFFWLYVAWDLPSVTTLKTAEGLQSLLMPNQLMTDQAMPNQLMANEAQSRPAFSPAPHDIPPHVLNAVAAVHRHLPKNLASLLLSARNERHGHLQTAVLALNIRLFLRREEISRAWLATAYFGKGVFGADAAATLYFDKPLAELNICETAMLASIPLSPATANPIDNPARARELQQRALDEMLRLGLTSESNVAACKERP